MYLCHPDFVGESLSNVVSQVELNDNKQLKQGLSNVVSNVVGTNFKHIFKVFIALQKETSLTELMTMFGQTNRDRLNRTSIDILIKTGMATPTIIDKPKSRNQKYVLTEAGRQLIKDCVFKKCEIPWPYFVHRSLQVNLYCYNPRGPKPDEAGVCESINFLMAHLFVLPSRSD